MYILCIFSPIKQKNIILCQTLKLYIFAQVSVMCQNVLFIPLTLPYTPTCFLAKNCAFYFANHILYIYICIDLDKYLPFNKECLENSITFNFLDILVVYINAAQIRYCSTNLTNIMFQGYTYNIFFFLYYLPYIILYYIIYSIYYIYIIHCVKETNNKNNVKTILLTYTCYIFSFK